ncbi:MAG: hypothetical protein ACOCX2_02460, partial [Armatimonadota bacterium]
MGAIAVDAREPGREYVEQMRADGYTDLDIRDALGDAGWTEDQIRRAMEPAPPSGTRREQRTRKAGGGKATAVWV